MRVIRDPDNILPRRNTILAIGVFDGVHVAHRAIIKSAIRQARRIHGIAAVMTFWPHPRRYKSLYSLEHRLRILEHLGIDECIIIPFTRGFAAMSPRAFVSKMICGRVKASSVYVGENFRFGKNAAGDVSALSKLLEPCHAEVRVFKTLKVNGVSVSSSHIRCLIAQGRLDAARKLLCAPVSVYGHVVAGTGRGRELGFPTANIALHHEITPPSGVYAVRVSFNGAGAKGICYIGTRPTFNSGDSESVVEVHIFDCKKNLYGKYLEARFILKLRDQRSFPSSAALIDQIKKDISAAKKALR